MESTEQAIFSGGAGGGALEEHVLDEVGDAVLLRCFAARTGTDPDADRDGAHVRHGFGDDLDAVGERGGANIALPGWLRLWRRESVELR